MGARLQEQVTDLVGHRVAQDDWSFVRVAIRVSQSCHTVVQHAGSARSVGVTEHLPVEGSAAIIGTIQDSQDHRRSESLASAFLLTAALSRERYAARSRALQPDGFNACVSDDPAGLV